MTTDKIWVHSCVTYNHSNAGFFPMQVWTWPKLQMPTRPKDCDVVSEEHTVFTHWTIRCIDASRKVKTKRRRSDSVLWQKLLHPRKCQKGKVKTQTTPQKSLIKQRLRTDLGRSVGVTIATQLVGKNKNKEHDTVVILIVTITKDQAGYHFYIHLSRMERRIVINSVN